MNFAGVVKFLTAQIEKGRFYISKYKVALDFYVELLDSNICMIDIRVTYEL